MANFLGEYEIALDAKGRFLLPSGLRKQIGEGVSMQFVVKRDFENCLTIYHIETWNAISAKLNKLNDLKKDVREFKRLFLNGATVVELDSADRMLVPKPLQEYAGIKKEAVLAAQGNKMELWDKDTYYNYLRQNAVNMSRLAEDVANDNGNLFENL
ncbi:MAG: mraZ [Flavipsychrobacter sp.]|jgi:MraZ protein|nr:mraZ [Flavipsychrobacter sp.]